MMGYELIAPRTMREAIAILDTDDPTVRAFSGGTALMLMMKTGVFAPTRLVSLQRIEAQFSDIVATADGGLTIGAMATLSTLERSDAVARSAPVIPQAMKRLANVRVRNVARLGGNLAHGDPHMDLPPILAALGSDVVIEGPGGTRRVAVEALYSGYYQTVLAQGELISHVAVPAQAGWSSTYAKCTTRSADDWPALGIAVALKIEAGIIRDLRLFVSAATDRLTRLRDGEHVLRGREASPKLLADLAEAAASEADTVDDSRGSAAFKTQLLRIHLRRAVDETMKATLQ